MFGINFLVAAYLAWRHDLGNILATFDRTNRRLTAAIDHHNGQVAVMDRHIANATARRLSHQDTAARAFTVRDRIAKLVD